MKDYFGYQNKVAVVTGAASGMGKATAEMLVDLGAKVYALDWAEVDVKGIEAYIHTDLSQKDSIDEVFAKIPEQIDSFFGIAGVSGVKNDFLTTVKIDLISYKYICENYLIHRMKENSSIAFMTSTAGVGWENEANMKYYLPVVQADSWEKAVEAIESSLLKHLPGNAGYSFSKLAMNYLVGQYQSLFASKKIRVNAVLPGSTDTGLTDDFSLLIGGQDNLLEYTGYAKRLALSEEMAGPIVYLNSDLASYVSGELMIVDYGSTIEATAKIKENPATFTFDMIMQQMLAAIQKEQ